MNLLRNKKTCQKETVGNLTCQFTQYSHLKISNFLSDDSVIMEESIQQSPARSDEASSSKVVFTKDKISFTQPNENITSLESVPLQKDEERIGTKRDGNETSQNTSPATPFHPCSCSTVNEENQENKKFLEINTDTTNNISVNVERKTQCSVRHKFLAASAVLITVVVVVGLVVYLSLRPKGVPGSTECNSSSTKAISLTEKPLPETTTVDPNTVETKVNESFYSYNFL